MGSSADMAPIGSRLRRETLSTRVVSVGGASSVGCAELRLLIGPEGTILVRGRL